jgi:hypothetical protein
MSNPPVVADLPQERDVFLIPVGADPPRHGRIIAPTNHTASNSSKRVGAGCEDVLLMRLSGLVSQRIEEDVRE